MQGSPTPPVEHRATRRDLDRVLAKGASLNGVTRERSLLRRITFGLVTTIGLLAALELGLRVLVSKDALLFRWERPDGMLEYRGADQFSLKPGTAARIEDGPYTWEVKINDQYFRESSDTDRTAPAGQYRVLALGDSWVFGWSTTQGRTLCDDLEVKLAEAMGRPVDVMNMGQFGATAFDIYRNWRSVADVYAFDAVLVGRPHNDVTQRERKEERNAWLSGWAPRPSNSSYVYLALRRLLYQVRAPATAVDSNRIEGPGSDPGSRSAHEDIARVVTEAQSAGKVVWLLDWPTDANGAVGARAPTTPTPAWVALAKSHGILLSTQTLPQRSCWGFDDQAHPSEAGAMAIAVKLAEDIAAATETGTGAATPSCDDVPGVGPGKDGWPAPVIAPRGPPRP